MSGTKKYIIDLLNVSDVYNKYDARLLSGIVSALPLEELKQIQEECPYERDANYLAYVINRTIERKEYKLKPKEKNLTVPTLLKYYLTPKSGKKRFAAKQLRNRFSALSDNDQKKVLLAFMGSTNTADMKWSFRQAKEYWDDIYLHTAISIFEEDLNQAIQPNADLRLFIIAHADEDYIYSHINTLCPKPRCAYPMDDFSESRIYFNIARRLINYKGFVLESKYLTFEEYFIVNIKNRNINADCLFNMFIYILLKRVFRIVERGRRYADRYLCFEGPRINFTSTFNLGFYSYLLASTNNEKIMSAYASFIDGVANDGAMCMYCDSGNLEECADAMGYLINIIYKNLPYPCCQWIEQEYSNEFNLLPFGLLPDDFKVEESRRSYGYEYEVYKPYENIFNPSFMPTKQFFRNYGGGVSNNPADMSFMSDFIFPSDNPPF